MGQNRGSIFFGVILLVVGVIFLLGQFLSITIWAVVWPAVLILIGLWLLVGRSRFAGSPGKMGESVIPFTSTTEVTSTANDTPIGTLSGENRPASTFNRVAHRGFGNLTLIQGEREELVINAPDAIRARIRVEVKNGTLSIYNDINGWDWFDFSLWGLGNHVEFRLTMRDIASLNISGAGNVTASQIKTGSLEIEHSGAGNIRLDGLETEHLKVRQHGAGNANLSGRTTDQDAVLSGAGNYEAGDLESKSAKVVMSGVGNAKIWASESLDVSLSGVGNIEYYGSPASLNRRVSGVGNLRAIGDHA